MRSLKNTGRTKRSWWRLGWFYSNDCARDRSPFLALGSPRPSQQTSVWVWDDGGDRDGDTETGPTAFSQGTCGLTERKTTTVIENRDGWKTDWKTRATNPRWQLTPWCFLNESHSVMFYSRQFFPAVLFVSWPVLRITKVWGRLYRC